MLEHELAGRFCSCGALNPRAKARYCRTCGAAASRRSYQNRSGVIALRRRNRGLSEEEKARRNARAYLAVYLKRGLVTIERCETCGTDAGRRVPVQPDPARPLEVRWFCTPHYRDFRVHQADIEAAEALEAAHAKVAGWRIADPRAFASKREWFQAEWPRLAPDLQRALRELAARKVGGMVGIHLSEESPLFQSALISVFDRYSQGGVVIAPGAEGLESP